MRGTSRLRGRGRSSKPRDRACEVATGVSRPGDPTSRRCAVPIPGSRRRSLALAARPPGRWRSLLDHRNTDAMRGQTVVASANVLYTLPRGDAATTLTQVLDAEPDLLGLQEWYVCRLGLLRQLGDVRVVPGLRIGVREPAYHWVSAVAGGNVVGARADRFVPVSSRAPFLSGIGRSDRPDRFLGLEPPREVTIGVFSDREKDRTVAMMSYHLTPGVEAGAEYRADRPRLRRRHESEVRRLERLIAEHQQAGHVVYAVGDSNFDGPTPRRPHLGMGGPRGSPGHDRQGHPQGRRRARAGPGQRGNAAHHAVGPPGGAGHPPELSGGFEAQPLAAFAPRPPCLGGGRGAAASEPRNHRPGRPTARRTGSP